MVLIVVLFLRFYIENAIYQKCLLKFKCHFRYYCTDEKVWSNQYSYPFYQVFYLSSVWFGWVVGSSAEDLIAKICAWSFELLNIKFLFHWVDFENTFLDGGKMKLVEENSIIVYIISECLMKSKTIFINFEPPPFRGGSSPFRGGRFEYSWFYQKEKFRLFA